MAKKPVVPAQAALSPEQIAMIAAIVTGATPAAPAAQAAKAAVVPAALAKQQEAAAKAPAAAKAVKKSDGEFLDIGLGQSFEATTPDGVRIRVGRSFRGKMYVVALK